MANDPPADSQGVVRFAELEALPWRNGGGLTREVVSAGGSGLAGFDWRVSIADVNEPGAFSKFPGVHRIITLVEGQGMALVVDGVEHVLGLYEPLSFDGLSRTSGSPLAGPVRDLNVMTREGLSASVVIRALSQSRPTAVVGSQVLVLLNGAAFVQGEDGARTELHRLDAVCPSGAHVRQVPGSGLAAHVRIEGYEDL